MGLPTTHLFLLSLKKHFVPIGSSSDKALDCMTHWSTTLEPEIVNTASEQAVKSLAWQKEWDSAPQPQEATSYSNSDLSKDQCHDQELVKRNHSIVKVTPTQGTPFKLRMTFPCTTVEHREGSPGQGLRSVSAPRTAPPEGGWKDPEESYFRVFACSS